MRVQTSEAEGQDFPARNGAAGGEGAWGFRVGGAEQPSGRRESGVAQCPRPLQLLQLTSRCGEGACAPAYR